MKNTISQYEIEYLLLRLLYLAKQSCWNPISHNCVFILSEIEKDFVVSREERKRKNDQKTQQSLSAIIQELNKMYANLYDINLFIYKAEKEKTIIDVRYYPKSHLNKDYYELVKNNEPMLHSKISIPPYQDNSSQKFDINWEHKGYIYRWKMWYMKIKYSLNYR